MILDAGVLISVDRGEDAARHLLTLAERNRHELCTTQPVVAQVWRNGARQARLARFLRSVVVVSLDDGVAVGRLLGQADTSDVVDAHLVEVAVRRGDDILTGDPGDLARLVGPLGALAPAIHAWP